jgi:hypothetical protein
MYGTITFKSAESVAQFLIAFTGSTAKFEIHEQQNGTWILEFTGGF